MLSKNDKFIRQSVAVTYLFISIVAMLYRDNVHIKRVRTKNGGCEQKPLKSHFYINIIFFSRKFTEIIKSERLKTKNIGKDSLPRSAFTCNVTGAHTRERYDNALSKPLYSTTSTWKNDCDNCFKIKNLKGGIFHANYGTS